ncbi:hypothetical protein GYMLUDRAFT_75576 [Collybiopsis luxurians FD-317 M1]|uniref:Anaphase-promoting complex subunit 4 WD40 domain-containing protein n=1 Tax=Collybiopsis luxurians FD-317 M1 TaxID=944289 RepID=A0A0D0B2J1_9AGAR|nr:hypothetical protein GYMLUDRAFT_75576 [Collybiopsis luxurians FD-317 M1]
MSSSASIMSCGWPSETGLSFSSANTPAVSPTANPASTEEFNVPPNTSNIENGLTVNLPTEDMSISASTMSRGWPSEIGQSSPSVNSPPVGPASPNRSNESLNTPMNPTQSSAEDREWQNAHAVRISSVMTKPGGAHSLQRQRTNSSASYPSESDDGLIDPAVKAVEQTRVATLLPELESLQPTQNEQPHQTLINHLRFSPDGKFLAASDWDRTSIIFRVQNLTIAQRCTLTHANGSVQQVAWSPRSHLLLIKLSSSVQVWTQDGILQRTIDRPAHVESITWFPDGEAFLSVEGSDVVKLHLGGEELRKYHFGSMKLQNAAITPDGIRFLAGGELFSESFFLVYNMETSQIERTTPALNDITLARTRNTRNCLEVLVSYENKVPLTSYLAQKTPPQLWKLETIEDTVRLILQHTYMHESSVDFAGPSCFGGKNDELVLGAGEAGNIYIWDRESGAMIHHVQAQEFGGNLTCIAWNPAVKNPFISAMFATGSHDGVVRIWTRREQPANL